MPRKRTTFFSLRYEKNYQYQILNAVHDMMQIGSCNLHRAICIILLFSFFQPSLIKQGSELHRNAARSLIYTDD